MLISTLASLSHNERKASTGDERVTVNSEGQDLRFRERLQVQLGALSLILRASPACSTPFRPSLLVVMRGTSPALQIAAKNFPRSESGELLKDGHRPSICESSERKY